MAALQAVILLVSAELLLDVSIGWGRAAALVLGSVLAVPFWFFALFAAAIQIRRVDAFSTFLNVVFLGALLLSPVFFPLDEMPGWFRAVAAANPLTWSVDVLRAIAFGSDRRASPAARGSRLRGRDRRRVPVGAAQPADRAAVRARFQGSRIPVVPP